LLKGIVDDTAARLARGEVECEQIATELHEIIIGEVYSSLGENDLAEHYPRAIVAQNNLAPASPDVPDA
jgi:hypothetical protein